MANTFGELIPIGGGDPIPMIKKDLLIGRRESCDIVLRFPNVSAHHCQLYVNGGYWYARDLKSRNGTKVNGIPITEKRLDPGDTLVVAKHKYEVNYVPVELGAVGPPPNDDVKSEIFGRSLLDRAGLMKQGASQGSGEPKRYDVLNDEAGQIRDPNRPV
ncbi:MAG: FHA domain-containing protein [Pirellulales bacterium]|jgi:adenylate cyclase|nr:FHA domain-containing protein [Pirellulales bacterium]